MFHHRTSVIVTIAALLTAPAVLSRPVHGQDVSGTVRDAATSEPVSGAVVVLLGPNRELLVRTITPSSGVFRFRQPNAALIRVLRIGYAPSEQRLEAAATRPLAIELTPLGRNLRPVAVTTRPVCPSRRDQREALAIWSSATDAMLAMVVASTGAPESGTVNQLLYNRLMSDDGRRIMRQSTRRVVTDNTSPIRADRDPDEFVETGYVVRRGDVTTYYGPDPEVLLDSSFAATHCLSIVTDARAHPGEVGVAFTPTRDRIATPDIAGVLWLNRSPMALRSLTFEYRGVDRAVIDMRAGGRLDFETMSDSVPIIRSWSVRSPKLGYLQAGRVVRGRVTADREIASVLEVHETGGMISGGRLADGTILAVPLATLGGRVLNARTDEPVPGARVTMDSTDQATFTDASGQFSFEDVLPGPYVLRIRDSVTITTGKVDSTQRLVSDSNVQQVVTRIATMPIDARVGHVTPRDVRLPWRTSVGGCGAQPLAERRFFVVGVVLGPGRTPVRSAGVRLSWADTTRGSTVETIVDAVADTGGVFFMCGIPASVPLAARVIATTGAEYRGITRVNLVDYDEQGRRRTGTLRAIKVVVSPPDSTQRP